MENIITSNDFMEMAMSNLEVMGGQEVNNVFDLSSYFVDVVATQDKSGKWLLDLARLYDTIGTTTEKPQELSLSNRTYQDVRTFLCVMLENEYPHLNEKEPSDELMKLINPITTEDIENAIERAFDNQDIEVNMVLVNEKENGKHVYISLGYCEMTIEAIRALVSDITDYVELALDI